MKDKNSKKFESVEESVVFQCLWSKKIFIVSITLLSIIAGFVHINLRPENYLVSSVIKFEKVTPKYVNEILTFGGVEFHRYKTLGRIDIKDSLDISNADKKKLKSLKNKIDIVLDVPNSQIVIKGQETDIAALEKDVEEVAIFIKKAMYSLSDECFESIIDSLSQLQNDLKTELQDSLKVVVLAKEKINNSSSLDAKVDVLYSEYYNDYFVSSKVKDIQDLQGYQNMFRNVEIINTPIKIEPVLQKLSNRPLLVRWVFFGFAGSCVCVLLYFQILFLLNRRKE